MRSLAVAVPKEKAEAIRQELLAQGVVRRGVSIAREGGTVFIPVTTAAIRHTTSEREFREAFVPIRSYKDVARVPSHLRERLPTSFDVVGDIAIVKIPDDLVEYEQEIAAAILRAHGSVKVVAADAGVKGPLRVRNLRVVGGEDRTETVHREFGLSYRIDVGRAYFSPRLGSERARVADQVRDGEVVVDLFSGVGPYAILIAKRRRPKVVHAFDANPEAYRYLEENVRLNRADRVRPRLGDGISLLPLVEAPDRILLDYPHGADAAYTAALLRVRPRGIVHYYAILDAVGREEQRRSLVDAAKAAGRDAEILAVKEVHGWSPARKLLAFDVRVS